MTTDYVPLPPRAVSETEAVECMRLVLLHLGYDAARTEGMVRTPERYVRAMQEMLSGERMTEAAVRDILAVTFDAGDYDEVACVSAIPFTSLCEHHLLPFTGTVSVAYLPGQAEGQWRVLGLSKLPRLVEVFARRLQLQERLTAQIATAIETHAQPRGVGVRIRATHGCVECRGVRKPGVQFDTQILRGVFREGFGIRAEVIQKLNQE
jgi:GTP cyclohydrolase I